ncbi:hypothetical protein ACOMHN_042357 [Nucella lapillus]
MEPGPQTERTEALQELVGSKSSPWNLDYSWSDEAKELREIAIKSPWLIDNQFVLNHFRTLKIVDKGNLTELTLTANFIHSVNSKHLPSSLQVLELCANEISDISALCVRPPLLLHLGLGYNSISFIDDYITGDYWPALLSLDLSSNNLTDLLDIVRKVSTLHKLRNLILLGNPLSLIPGYRGYTIDSLRKLSVLDDIRISADERHHFKGLARRREYILDEAKVALEVTYLKGVPLPDEIKHPEDQPEYPIIERNYYVQFLFPADLSAHGGRLHPLGQDDLQDLATSPTPTPLPDAEPQETASSDMQSARLEGSQQSGSHKEKNVIFSEQQETKVVDSLTLPLIEETDEPPRSASAPGSQVGQGHEVKASPEMQEAAAAAAAAEGRPRIPLAPISSVGKPWAEKIELDWKAYVTRFDLTALRDFLRQGMDFSVVEEMVLCYPVEEEENVDTPTGSKKSKDGSKDKKDAKGKVSSAGQEEDKVTINVSRYGFKVLDTSGQEVIQRHPLHTISQLIHYTDGTGKPNIALRTGQVGKPVFHCYIFQCHTEDQAQAKRGASGKKDPTIPLQKGGASGKKDLKNAGHKEKLKSAGSGKDKPKGKGGKDDKVGKKKKKGEPEHELRREAPQVTTLASFHIPLTNFLEGEFDFKSVFTQGGVEIAPSTARSAGSADPKKDKKDGKDKKKGVPSPRGKKDDKKDGKGGKDDKKDAKGKKGGHPAPAAEDSDETPPPPPPLEVEVSVHLHHWTTAMDSVREEEKMTKEQ